MKRSHLPNLITIVRILLVVPLVWAVASGHYLAALVLFAVAALSDGIDGFLARHYGWTSRLGGVLDPLADKLLLASSYLMLGWQGYLPVWVVIAVIGRDVIIIAGAAAYRYLIEPPPMEPSLISKANTLLQIVLVSAVFVSLAVLPLPQPPLMLLAYLVLASTLASGTHYVWTWGRRAYVSRTGQ